MAKSALLARAISFSLGKVGFSCNGPFFNVCCTSPTSASDMKGLGIVATTFGNFPATHYFVHVTRHHDNWHERSAVISSDATTNFVAFDVGKDVIDQIQVGYNARGFFYAVQTG